MLATRSALFFLVGMVVFALPATGRQATASRFEGRDRDSDVFPGRSYPNRARLHIVLEDLDGDGDVDVIGSGYDISSTVGLIGVQRNEKGRFLPPDYYPVGPAPDEIELADLNGDGAPDVVVELNGALSTLLNRGDGTFFQDRVISVPFVRFLETGDIDGDGSIDLVTFRVLGNTHRLAYFKGDGAGGFGGETALAHFQSSGGVSVHTGDVNGDDIDDVAISSGIEDPMVSFFILGQDGFERSDIRVQSQVFRMAVTDLNEDGLNDLAMMGFGTRIRLNRGEGSFPVVDAALDDWARFFDLDGDGVPDAVSSRGYQLNDGAANFQPAVTLSIPHVTVVEAGDVDMDRDVDLIGTGGLSVIVLENLGGLSFPEHDLYVQEHGNAGWVGDLNGDDAPDVVAVGIDLNVFLNDGEGTLADGSVYDSASQPRDIAAADFFGRGHFDLATVHRREVGLFPNAGDGTFPTRLDFPIRDGRAIAAGDFDGNGRPDTVTAGRVLNAPVGLLTVLFNEGPSNPVRIQEFPSGSGSDIELGDLDLDGDVDLVVASQTLGLDDFTWMRNTGEGAFEPERIEVTNNQGDTAASDLDSDGWLDLVLQYRNPDTLAVFRNRGGGHFGSPEKYRLADPLALKIADFDGDRIPDVIAGVGAVNYGQIVLFRGNGDGSLGHPEHYMSSVRDLREVLPVDLDRNGTIDLAQLGFSNGSTIRALTIAWNLLKP